MSFAYLRHCMGAALLCGASLSHSAALVTNLPNQVSGTNMSFALVADNFSLGGAGSYDINTLQFWSLMESVADYSGSVYWAIYSDAAGSPGAVLHSGTAAPAPTATGLSSGFGYGEYRFDIAVNFNLAAGATYWLALQNDFLGNDVPSEMLLEHSDSGLGGAGQYVDFQGDPGEWLDAEFDHAFAIIGNRVGDPPPPPPPPLPTPATWMLVLGGLVGAARVRRPSKSSLVS